MSWYKIAKRNKLDIEAREITRKIFDQIKEGRIYDYIKQDLPGPIKKIEWYLRNWKNPDKKNIDIAGSFDPDIKWLELNIYIPVGYNSVPKHAYSKLYSILYNVIRHEIEHSYQSVKGENQYPDMYNFDLNSSMYRSMYNMTNYLLSKHETEAYVKAFYVSAKKQRKPFSEVVSNWLNSIYKQFIDKDLPETEEEARKQAQRVYTEWMQYASSVLPKIEQDTPLFTEAQVRHGYHGSSIELLEDIRESGLEPSDGEIFFATNEDDLAPYVDGLWLRFPWPQGAVKRIGRGDYFTIPHTIPPQMIEFKTNIYDDYRPLI